MSMVTKVFLAAALAAAVGALELAPVAVNAKHQPPQAPMTPEQRAAHALALMEHAAGVSDKALDESAQVVAKAAKAMPKVPKSKEELAKEAAAIPAAYIPWVPSAKDDADLSKHPLSMLRKSKKHHSHKGKDGKMVQDNDDDDDDDFPKIHFHFHTMSMGGFKMDEGATILHTMLGKLGDDDYKTFAALVATNHSLATNPKITDRLHSTLSNLQKGGADFLLAAAGASYPNMPEQTRRSRFIQMLTTALAVASKPVAASGKVSFPVCNLNSLPADGAIPDVLAFGDASLENSTAPDASADKKKAELEEAKKEYLALKKQMGQAQGRLMTAMDALLEVPSADGAALASLVEKKEKDAFVVFYAPWCPHCQTYVLHDGKGDPTKAPLETLRQDLKKDPATKDVEVLRFDVQAHRDIPKAMAVQYIPSVYFVAAGSGKITKFEGDHTTPATKAFIIEHKGK